MRRVAVAFLVFLFGGCGLQNFTSDNWIPEKVTWHSTQQEADPIGFGKLQSMLSILSSQRHIVENQDTSRWWTLDTMLTFSSDGRFTINYLLIGVSKFDSAVSFAVSPADTLGYNYSGVWNGSSANVVAKSQAGYFESIDGPWVNVPNTERRDSARFITSGGSVVRVIFNGNMYVPLIRKSR